MADLDGALRRWAADHAATAFGEFVSSNDIEDVEMLFNEGWPGTDVTPGDPPEFTIRYTINKIVYVQIEGKELTKFISDLVKRS